MKLIAAGSMALAGESKKALEVAADLSRKRPDDTLVQSISVPIVQAAAALSAGNGARVIEILKVAAPYDKGTTPVLYLRGLGYLKTGQGTGATQEFQRILALRNFASSDPLMSLAHLGLGRAYALSGDSSRSRSAYQDFFALWKDAIRPPHPEGSQSRIREAAVGCGVACSWTACQRRKSSTTKDTKCHKVFYRFGSFVYLCDLCG